MGNVKLHVVIAGKKRWRLGTSGDAAQYLCEFPCERVKVILPKQAPFYLDKQMTTYNRHHSLSHPNIKEWIVQRGWNHLNGQEGKILPFRFSIEGNTHVYEYIGGN